MDPPESTNPHIGFEVIDSGVGMAPQQRVTIFKPFSQADDSMTRRFGGTGLGLTISKRLAQMLGGDITTDSVLGKGSSFLAVVETGSLDGVRMLDAAAEALASETEQHSAAEAPLAEPPQPRPAETSDVRLDGRVLLAEDGIDNQRLIAFLLRKRGASVALAENGQLAIESVVQARDAGQPFDCILMDMQMPVLDGYAATQRLRDAGCHTPIIALTAHAMRGDRERCIEAGCDDYLAKPVDRKELIEMVARYLGRPLAAAAPDASQGVDNVDR
jgi:CheY-like chemotaxis protein